MRKRFNLHKLFKDVFHLEKGDCILVMTDTPLDKHSDNKNWIERREMATEWHESFQALSKDLGFKTLPLVTFSAVKEHNKDPLLQEGTPMKLAEALSQSTLAVALTEKSISAFLLNWANTHADFRAASLPGVARRMEKTALMADYSKVADRCKKLGNYFLDAEMAKVKFSTGHVLQMDLRYRKVYLEDGQLPRNKVDNKVINLPSGEVFIAPYEGEKENDPSRTEGEIPVSCEGEVSIFKVLKNRIVEVIGNGHQSDKWRSKFEADEARRNVAELGLGCNPHAVVWGNILEDEKVGFHWAFGRSDHYGGTIGKSNFKSPETVIHQDIIYAKGCPIQADSLIIKYSNGSEMEIIKNKKYIIFK